MLNLLNELDFGFVLAKLLLSQAGIPPLNDHGKEDEGDQYGIEVFEIDVNCIRITNNGVEHFLRIEKGHIPPNFCQEGYLYRVDARNGWVGICGDKKGFFLSRHKFGMNFVDYELHWDEGPPHGTAKPLFLIEKVPDNILNGTDAEKLVYLNGHTEKYWKNPWPVAKIPWPVAKAKNLAKGEGV